MSEELTDQQCPHSHKREQTQVRALLQGKDERENMVRQALRPAIQRVESVAGKRRRNDPFVVWLVEPAVYSRVMEATVNPVDPTVGKADEERVLQQGVAPEWGVGREIV